MRSAERPRGTGRPATTAEEIDALVAQIRQKDAFLLAVAHDLKASLSAIAGSIDVLRARQPEHTERAGDALIDNMHRAVQHAESVIANLVDAERLEHGVAELVRQPTRLPELVLRALEAVGIADRVEVDVDDAVAMLDAGLVERILTNLLANAVRHTPPGTWISVCGRDEGGHVLFHVDDAGPGVPEELREEMFEAFRRGSGRGMGVGLYLVREFARYHDGDAWVEDRPGGGTSVRVRLPTS